MTILPFIRMINSSSFKSKLCKPQFITALSEMIDHCEDVKSPLLDEFRRAIFQAAESMAKHHKILMSQTWEIFSFLLPQLIKKVESESAEIRIASLKIFTDYITQYLCEEKIYNIEENNQTT